MSIINNRCGIFIDIEGTSKRYENNEIGFYQSLDCLLSSALKGVRFELPRNNEFFLHQMGMDGLFLLSRYGFGRYTFPNRSVAGSITPSSASNINPRTLISTEDPSVGK